MRIVTLAATMVLTACGGSSETDENTQAQLWQVSVASSSEAPLTQVSGQPLARYLKNGLYAQAAVTVSDGAVPTPADPGVSATNVITAGVDEADRVKFAGQTLYVSGWQSDTETPYVKRWQRNADSSLTALEPLLLAPQLKQVHGLYADTDLLAVLGDDGNAQIGFPVSMPGWGSANAKTSVQFFQQGSSVYQLEFDGNLIDSRRTAEALWLVSRYQPDVAGYRPYAASVADKQNNMLVLDNASLTDLLPKRRLNGSIPEPMVVSQQCYLPADSQANEGSSQLVLLTRIATTGPYQTETSRILASGADFYMSTENLYLYGSVNYESHSRTVLHKFSLDDSAVGYQASGAVDGYIGGSQSAFMLHEKQQQLMLFTSSWGDNGLSHQFQVLQQQDDRLEVVAQLPNAGQPDQLIGKPGEDIYGARFVGDRAYVVTFERTDPLYTLDISNPLQPAIIGELEIPGYSAYLHSISDDLLWGLGQQLELDSQGNPIWQSGAAKMALFNVAANDALVQDELVFTGQFAPLEYQHHSLTTTKQANTTRMAIPLSRYVQGTGEQISLLTLEVSDNGTMHKTGELQADALPDGSSWGARSVLVNDDIYFVVADKVLHSQWQQPEQVLAQY